MTKRPNTASFLAPAVFLLFALCLVLTVLAGAGVYRKTLEDGQKASDTRTLFQYLSTRVRQAEDLTVEPFGSGDALVIRESVDGECYVTYVYSHEGWLKELYCAEGSGLTPADGEKLLPAQFLELCLEEGLLEVRTEGERLYFDCA